MGKNKEKIAKLNEKIKENSVILKDITDELLGHYKFILKQGKDVRNEGLVWVMKAIWELGENLHPSYFPSFLDEQSIKYLFEVISA